MPREADTPQIEVVLSKTTSEEDFEQIVALQCKDRGLNQGREFTPEQQEMRLYNLRLRRRKEFADPNIVFVKAVLEGTDNVVGFGIWTLPQAPIGDNDEPVLDKSKAKLPEDPKDPVCQEVDFLNEVLLTMHKRRREVMRGKPHWFPKFLFVDSAVRSLGLGRKLLMWACHAGDASNPPVPTYLEATDAGRKLYESAGFEMMGEDEIHTDWLKEGYWKWPYMIRQPKKPGEDPKRADASKE